ncbi:SGNH/GDSL hydrolase family protein [Noviherbaspirillum suwonense]|uniref:GDSL-like Lipase/Acylhydrolase family protein n=1 Tax=Noviherbaspirillum suwonense TaxID=1224511 RepID=A0ABY1QTB9_9BURK|nr:SGNH/GDSL hydrolase family protein [Noviherbaspirillum suwonense]SMP79659.1 GDSL-like Lipase/Acylhydrolase family protein [Noviherbaspirillum suwonense]
MRHVFLLGDSIFDNAPYVPKGCEVQAQLQAMLGDEHRVILLARDGDVLADVKTQVSRLRNMPAQFNHVVVSCGGNDVLGLVGHMQLGVKSVLEAAELLASWQAEFRIEYRRMLDEVLAPGLPVVIATIYDGVPGLSPGLRTALAVFNDVILREAAARRLPVLDLRLVCDHPGDYSPASPIEPSQQGGRKIAAAIAELVRSEDMSVLRTVVFGAGLN